MKYLKINLYTFYKHKKWKNIIKFEKKDKKNILRRQLMGNFQNLFH
jgi:hypothetical protein